MDTSTKRTIEQKLDDVQRVANQLISLLRDRRPGLMTWNELLISRLRDMRGLVDELVEPEARDESEVGP